jgi:hypothetical protein
MKKPPGHVFIFLFAFAFAFAVSASAANSLPKNLSTSDRETTLGALGFGSAVKVLSSPYPLGGYSGVELSVSSEYIPMTNVAVLGTKINSRADLSFLNFSVGKGLYQNVDIFIQFIPMPQDQSITGFGGQLRWGFYQASFIPANLTLLAHGSSINFYNQLGTETNGFDLIASVNMKDVSLFFGGGRARSIGNFVGGADGVKSSNNSESADLSSPHSVFGISVKMASVFLALEVDRFVQSTYAGKLGLRF